MENRHLTARRQERDTLLEQIVTALKNDNRVVAAFLWGSLGRGTADDLSDIDIWAVVKDDSLPDILQNITALARSVRPPLLIMEQPYNGPLGGTAFHAIYDGERTGAQNADWYIQPASTAILLLDTEVLFDRIGLQQSDSSDYPRNPGRELSGIDSKIQDIRFFWLMLLICAKYAYRSPDEERMGLLVYPVNCLNYIRQFLDLPVGLSAEEMLPQPSFASKIAVLHTLADEMATLMDIFERRFPDEFTMSGISPEIVASVKRFIDFIRG